MRQYDAPIELRRKDRRRLPYRNQQVDRPARRRLRSQQDRQGPRPQHRRRRGRRRHRLQVRRHHQARRVARRRPRSRRRPSSATTVQVLLETVEDEDGAIDLSLPQGQAAEGMGTTSSPSTRKATSSPAWSPEDQGRPARQHRRQRLPARQRRWTSAGRRTSATTSTRPSSARSSRSTRSGATSSSAAAS